MERRYGTFKSILSATLYLLYPILSIQKILFLKKTFLLCSKNFVNTEILSFSCNFLGGVLLTEKGFYRTYMNTMYSVSTIFTPKILESILLKMR